MNLGVSGTGGTGEVKWFGDWFTFGELQIYSASVSVPSVCVLSPYTILYSLSEGLLLLFASEFLFVPRLVCIGDKKGKTKHG